MAKKKQKEEVLPDIPVEDVNVSDALQKWMAIYGTEVNTDRAIPDFRDGLKPVQRRILYVAWLNKLTPTAKYKKCANLVGNVMQYHPHGDTGIYDALVVLAQDWKMRVPLIDIHGNCGDISGNDAAAPRYTETRLGYGALEVVKNYKKSVTMRPNYDNSAKEPAFFPSAMPNALINATNAIGQGIACTNLPHNPIEALDAALAIIKNPDITDEELLKIIPAPDFPTGGTIVGKSSSMEEMKTGKGSFTVRGHMFREEHPEDKETWLVMDAVPFGVKTTDVIEQINKLVVENPGLNMGVAADETSSRGLRIVVKFKNTQFIDEAEELIWKKTNAETTITANTLMLVDGMPMQIGVHEFLNRWVKFRKEILTKELNFDLKIEQDKLNIVAGLIKLSDNLQDVVGLVRKADGRQDFINALIKYGFNEAQAENIAGIPFYRLSKQDTDGLYKSKDEIENNINVINDNLAHIDRYLSENIEEVKQGLIKDDNVITERLTDMVNKVEHKKVNLNKLQVQTIDSKPAYVAVLANTTAHRMTNRIYTNNIEEAKKIKPIVDVVQTKTDDWMLLLTNSGQAVTRLVNDLENINPKYDVDSFARQIKSLKTSDKFIAGIPFNEKVKKTGGYILSVTELGLAKLSLVESSMPNTSTKRYLNNLTKFNGLKNEGDSVNVAMYVTPKDVKEKAIHITLSKGRDITHNLDDISVQGAGGSGGRKVHAFKKSDIVSVELIDK